MAKYKGQDVRVIRPWKKGDPRWNLLDKKLFIKTADGSELFVFESEVSGYTAPPGPSMSPTAILDRARASEQPAPTTTNEQTPVQQRVQASPNEAAQRPATPVRPPLRRFGDAD